LPFALPLRFFLSSPALLLLSLLSNYLLLDIRLRWPFMATLWFIWKHLADP